uniref:Ycf20 n=1 Tax=Boodleopsis sp. FL1161 TaxID=2364084 RepID=A0A386AZ96_9CHLO|nr:hypothetical protein Ycf20 [Boodleopsis sp. FL1161]
MKQLLFLVKKRQQLKNYFFLKSACSFYFGLICGNLFGTFLNFLRNEIVWDGTVLIILILFFDFINFLVYKKKFQELYLTVVKNYQIGILIGLFIDAFKVGS